MAKILCAPQPHGTLQRVADVDPLGTWLQTDIDFPFSLAGSVQGTLEASHWHLNHEGGVTRESLLAPLEPRSSASMEVTWWKYGMAAWFHNLCRKLAMIMSGLETHRSVQRDELACAACVYLPVNGWTLVSKRDGYWQRLDAAGLRVMRNK